MCGYRVNKNEVKNMCVIGVCGLCVNEWYRVIHYGEGNFQATKKKNVNKKNKPKCKSMGKIIINNESANEMA